MSWLYGSIGLIDVPGIVGPFLGRVRVRVRDQKREPVLIEIAFRELELGAVDSLDAAVESAAQPERQPTL